MSTVGELLHRCEHSLAACCGAAAAFEAAQLTAFALALDPLSLRQKRGEAVSPAAEERLNTLTARRASGEPLQYLLGQWEFYSLPFRVDPTVLIPRPDTELLVDCALAFLKERTAPAVLDLCTGSGCVGIAIAKNRPDASVTGIELSGAAARTARENALFNKASDFSVREGDLFTCFTGLSDYDCIVCNPPYLTAAEMSALSPEVAAEPSGALFGGEDGLDFYRCLARDWPVRLKKGGALFAEVGFTQSAAVRALFETTLSAVGTARDISGIERVVYGFKNVPDTARSSCKNASSGV